ncbi:MAG: DMT family transporter [Bacillota bacterium]|nr:DMT family transporter [Bacillota bacterium]
MYIGISIALLAGIFISVQGSLNGMVGNNSSVAAVVSIPVAVQMVIYFVVIIFNGGFRNEIAEIFNYNYGVILLIISAFLGIGIMITLTVSVMKVGPLLALSTVVFSQLLLSMIIEHFGWFNMAVKTISFSRILGLVFMIFGIMLFIRK